MGSVSKCYIAIDPGVSGAVALIDPDGYKVFDIPVMRKGEGFVKYEVNARGLQDILREHVNHEPMALIERVNAMPGQGGSSMFSLGDSFGACRATLACCRFPYMHVTPSEWKKHYKLSRDKEEARAMAIKMFPEAELHLKKHVDRAEALLMAAYLKTKMEDASKEIKDDKTV